MVEPEHQVEESAPVNPRVARSQARILEAAVQVLLEHGPAAFSVDAVVRASGVGKMTVYRHWPSRSALLVDTFRSLVPDRGAPPIEAGDQPLEALEATIVEYGRQFATAAWADVMPALLEQAAHDPELQAISIEMAEARRIHLRGVLASCVAQGHLDGDFDPDLAVAQLIGPLAFRHMITHEPIDDGICRRIVTDFVRAHRRTGP